MRHKRINWRNIYYMLTYAVDGVAKMELGDVVIEKCNTLDDLFAGIMCRAMEVLEANNYLREYTEKRESIDRLKGRLDIKQTFGTSTYAEGKLHCKFFELNNDSIYNQIIKRALTSLITYGKGINEDRYAKLLRYIEDLSDVRDSEIDEVDLIEIDYESIPIWYKAAILASKLVIENLLARDEDGNYLLLELNDEERLNHIFEAFVRTFLQLEYKKARVESPYYLTDSGKKKLDILVEKMDEALIIDTKWYSDITNNKQSNNREMLDYGETYTSIARGHRKLNCLIIYAKTIDKVKLAKPDVRFAGEAKEFTIYEDVLDLDQEFDKIKRDIIAKVEKFITA